MVVVVEQDVNIRIARTKLTTDKRKRFVFMGISPYRDGSTAPGLRNAARSIAIIKHTKQIWGDPPGGGESRRPETVGKNHTKETNWSFSALHKGHESGCSPSTV